MEDEKHGIGRNSVSIPLDLMVEIFTRLPAKSLMKFKCLSKQYASIVQSRNFVDSFSSYSSNRPRALFSFFNGEGIVLYTATTHTDESSSTTSSTVARHVMTIPGHGNLSWIRTPPVRGLICYSITSNQHVICNPSTRQLLHLPRNPTWKDKDFDEYLLFGYEPISDRFKVICILAHPRNLEHQFWIFTVGDGNSWKKMQDLPYPYRPVLDRTIGICINGVLYYKVNTKSRHEGDGSVTKQVVSFDLNSEKFDLIKFPPDVLEIPKLIDFQGKLAFIDRVVEICVWVLEDAEKHEWSKMYNLPWSFWYSGFYELPAADICEGEIVFVPDRVRGFFSWHLNLEKTTIRRVAIEMPSDNFFDLNYFSANHVENVVFL